VAGILKDQIGSAHFVLMAMAVVGLLSFLVMSSTVDFKDGIYSSLYPKKSSFASDYSGIGSSAPVGIGSTAPSPSPTPSGNYTLQGSDGTWCIDSNHGQQQYLTPGSCQDQNGTYSNYCSLETSFDYYCTGAWDGTSHSNVRCEAGGYSCSSSGYTCSSGVCTAASPTPIPTSTPIPSFNLSGSVFLDNNKNGIKDSGEGPLSDFPISIDPPNAPGQFPDSLGNYLFSNLNAGDYSVKIIFAPESGYQTTTSNPKSITLNTHTTVDFGLYPPQPPIISNVVVKNITATSAEITWTTTEPSTSGVIYNTNTKSLKSGPSNTNMVTNHTITLTGLSKNTKYYYRTHSQNGPHFVYSSLLDFRTSR
jgi:hypothetical protein